MPGWFAPKCPVGYREKVWTERRMRWLADRLGIERMLRAQIVLPDALFFSEPHAANGEHARMLLDRLCARFGLEPGAVDFEVLDDDRVVGAVGLYGRNDAARPLIRVVASLLSDPIGLVATLAHELAHEVLLGRGLISDEESDHEWVTDLLTVFLGLGVFTANATITQPLRRHKAQSQPTVEAWGYLTSQQLGYALALFAFLRGEEAPAWAAHLRIDAATSLRDGLRFLHKGGDTLFHPDTVRAPLRPPATAEAVRLLRDGGPAARIAALWDIVDHQLRGSDVARAVGERLRDREPCVRAEAAVAVGAFGPAAHEWVPELIRALEEADDAMRASVAYALGAVQSRPAESVPALRDLLDDPASNVVWCACTALGMFGRDADAAAPRLLDVLLSAVVDCDYPLIDHVVECLRQVTTEPLPLARQRFAEADPELRRGALRALRGAEP